MWKGKYEGRPWPVESCEVAGGMQIQTGNERRGNIRDSGTSYGGR